MTAALSEFEPQFVLDLLRKQVRLYEALQSLASKQRDLVTHEDTAPLLALLAARQRLAGKLKELGDQMAPIRLQWSIVSENMNDGDRAEADRLLGEVRAHLRRLIEQDETDARMLSARKQRVGQAMSAVRQGRSAIQAYQSEATLQTARLDQMHQS